MLNLLSRPRIARQALRQSIASCTMELPTRTLRPLRPDIQPRSDIMNPLSQRHFGILAVMLLAVWTLTATAQERTLGTIERYDGALDQLIPAGAKLEILGTGFAWCEGPVWMPDKTGGHLLFSDIPRNSVFKWKEGEGVSLFLRPSGYTGAVYYGLEPGSNGLTRNPQGRLVLFEHGDRRVSVLTQNGGKRTLVDNYRSKRLNSPNDGCFKSNGDLYFTDPPYGLPARYDDPRRELDFCGVYRLSTAGELTLLTDQMTRPNGIAFSHDEQTLYVAQSDSAAAIWMAFPVQADGTLGAGRKFCDVTEYMGQRPGAPDGLKVDAKGNVFATGPGGVYVFSPQAKLLGLIRTDDRTGNCNWGNDGSTLYVMVNHTICRIQTTTKGAGWR